MRLALPPKGTLVPNDEHDPLPYYYRPLTGWLYRKRLTMALSLLPPRTPRQHVLEVGVGSGILIPTLSAAFGSYTGTDLVLAKGLYRLVAPTCSARFLQADLLAPSSLPAASFDCIVCLSVLEHIADADAAATALACALAKGGMLVVGYPMVNGIMTRLFQLIGFGNIDDHHVTAPKTIQRALRRVLRPVARKALPAFAPVSLSLYQCAAWVKD
jgi:SAM-dependent methyltransferase